MIRYVIRPSNIRKTPTLLAKALGVETRRWPGWRGQPDWNRDFYIAPTAVGIPGTPELSPYRSFIGMNKYDQRKFMEHYGVPVPETENRRYISAYWPGGQFIVRRMRHQGGTHYKITDDNTDFIEGQEYISRVFPKEREYRIIYVLGKALITLRKYVDRDARPEEAWNHTHGASFVTCKDRTVLHKTDIFRVLDNFPVTKNAHLCGVDVMWHRDHGYRIIEINSCPALTIEDNLQKVAEYVTSASES